MKLLAAILALLVMVGTCQAFLSGGITAAGLGPRAAVGGPTRRGRHKQLEMVGKRLDPHQPPECVVTLNSCGGSCSTTASALCSLLLSG